MVETSERHELGADEVSRLLAAHGAERARGAVVIGGASPPSVWWANRAAVELFGSDLAEVLEGRLFGGTGRQGLADAVGRLTVEGGPRQERLRLSRGFATRTVPVTIRRLRDNGRELLVLTSGMADAASRAELTVDALRPASRAASVATQEEPIAPSVVVPVQESQPARQDPTPAAELAKPAATRPPALFLSPPLQAPARLTELGARRFLWQSDEVGRLVGLDDAVRALRHHADGSLIGKAFVPALEAVGITGTERLAELLAAQRSFNNARLSWPLQEPGWSTTVLLGAVPVRGAAGVFQGFRGFGVLDFAKLTPHVEEEGPTQAVPDMAARDEVGAGPEAEEPGPVERAAVLPPPAPDSAPVASPPPEELPLAESPAPSAASSTEADTNTDRDGPAPPTAPEIQVVFESANVVALRPSRIVAEVAASPAANTEAAASDSLSAAEDVLNLSSDEQSNFAAIAKALRRASAVATAAEPSRPAPGDAVPMLEAMPVAILVDRGGEPVYANAAFAALTGYASVAEMQEAGGLHHMLGGLEAAKVLTREGDCGFPLIAASGDVIPVEGRRVATEWRGESAEMLVFRAAPDHVAELQARDIEARRQAAEAAECRTLLDRVEDAVVVLDARGRVLSLNAAARRLLGREDGDAIGESVGAFLSADGQSAVLGAVFAAGASGPEASEVTIAAAGRRRPGAPPFDVSVRALAPGRVGLVIRDRSAGEALREQARQLRDELDNAAQTRVDFLAKVSHQIRTPLNSIIGFAELMLEERFGPVGSPRYLDYLTDIHDAGKHVVGLLGDLVDLSSATGAPPATPAATDINAVVGESVAELQGQAHRDRVIVRQSLAGNLPRALVDAEAMRQVMDNILSNAIQFNEPGGQVIVSTALHESGAVVVRVRDTGIGMSDAELAIAMEPFRQVGSGKPGAGSGLGLPLARALIEANQATLSIRSRKSEGTLVEVALRPAPQTADIQG